MSYSDLAVAVSALNETNETLTQAVLETQNTTVGLLEETQALVVGIPVHLEDYAALRMYAGRATRFEITKVGIAGVFIVDVLDTTSADNGCTIIVDGLGRRVKRDFSGLIRLDWCEPYKDGTTPDLAAFTKAARVAGPNDRAGGVVVSKGSHLLTSAVPTGTRWILEPGALIVGSPLIDALAQDTGFLTGTIVNMNPGGYSTLRVGGSSPWLSKLYRSASDSFAELVVAGRGRIGGLFYSRTSDANAPDMSCIGVSAFGVNDNTVNPEPAWANYMEAIRLPNTGPTFNGEWDMINLGNTYDMHPYSPVTAYGSIQAATVNLWISCGGGTSDLTTTANDASAAIGILPNGKKFRRGIVFRSGALDPALNEAVVMYEGNKLAWYDTAGGRNSYIDNGIIDQKRVGDDDNFSVFHNSRRRRSSNAATVSLDRAHSSRAYGWTGAADYLGTEVVSLQRTAFSGDLARFSYDISAKNSAGTSVGVTVNGSGDNSFAPKTTGVLSLGTASAHWTVVYADTATISTSDARKKTAVRAMTEPEIAAAKALGKEIGFFKFLASVEEKGGEAREHCGMTVQRVIEIFEEYGLDPFNYSFICHDTQEDDFIDHPAETDDKGEVINEAWTEQTRIAGDSYSFRETGLYAFIARGFEARLAALEAM